VQPLAESAGFRRVGSSHRGGPRTVAGDDPCWVRLGSGQYDVCPMTYEKCAALVLGQPHILNDVGTVVVDEVQSRC
jgi:superfamily II helicase